MLTAPPEDQSLPIACDPTAIATDERANHFARTALLFEAVQEQQELPDGYAFRFPAALYPLLVDFIGNERLCCPFFRFVVEVTPAQGPIWLRITGDHRVKKFIQSEFIRATAASRDQELA